MKLNEIKSNGVYVAVRPTADTIKTLKKYIKENKIKNAIDDHEFHATVLYSRAHINVESSRELTPPWKGKPQGFEIWDSPPNPNKEEATQCIVLRFECSEITEHHLELIKQGGTHDYNDFRPHLTLSYDVGDLNKDDLPKYENILEFNEEYSEPLNPGKVYKKDK